MNKTTSLSDLVLIALEKSVDGYIRLEDFLINTHIYAKSYDRPLKKASFSQAIRRLRNKGFIEYINQENILIKLTDEGKTHAIWEEIIHLSGVWDGKWRIVAFDIPQTHTLVRNVFRRRLKEFGFKQLQKSIWISKTDCTDLLRQYLKDLGIAKWVSVLEAENVDFG
jgi:phenylacetic acid degradation operon negative regulatory protein